VPPSYTSIAVSNNNNNNNNNNLLHFCGRNFITEYNTLQYSTVQYSAAQHSTAQQSTVKLIQIVLERKQALNRCVFFSKYV
jgi:hypothetical protein